MDRLSGLDASFLYLETPAQLMHVCGGHRARPDDHAGAVLLRRAADRASRAGSRDVPAFTRKLRRVPLGLDHPVWVRGQAVRHRAPRAPARAAQRRAATAELVRAALAHLAGAAARPVPAAVGDVGHRGLRRRQGRGLLEDAPRHRRRRLRLEPDLAPVLARAGRRAARLGRGAGRVPATPAARELLGRAALSRPRDCP